MATQNVIDYSAFSKVTTITNKHYNSVREPEAEYGSDDLSAKISALLNRPLWPQFADGAYLNSLQACQLYRAAQGVSGLVHILNRSRYPGDGRVETLNEPERSKLWNALIELSGEMMRLVDDLLLKSMEEMRG